MLLNQMVVAVDYDLSNQPSELFKGLANFSLSRVC